ncbi:hypothetical protein K503DRAFT_806052, partial [Rhizopogon vinicolor AM-OR11-026]
MLPLHSASAKHPLYMPSSRSGSPLSAPIPTFPPPPQPLALPLSSSHTRAATSTLSRALSLAFRKPFGATPKPPVSPSAVHYSTSSPRYPQLILQTPSEREKEKYP